MNERVLWVHAELEQFKPRAGNEDEGGGASRDEQMDAVMIVGNEDLLPLRGCSEGTWGENSRPASANWHIPIL